MALDEAKLIGTVEATIKSTFSGETYTHNLRLEFGNPDEMMGASTCLRRHYSNRFKISTEIQPPIDGDAKYFVLMGVI